MKIAIIAGEPSGDILAAEIMNNLNDWTFEGVGGEEMTKAGLVSLFPMQELSVMGIGEVLPKARHLLKRVRETVEFVIAGDFDALITVDSPDFSFRVAKRVKRTRPDLRIIHYVAPSVWAWRAGRAKKMSRFVDHVLCLLPFEPPYMHEVGMSADFVGHSVSRLKKIADAEIEAWRANQGPVVALFPGSRNGEVKRHLATYKEMWMQANLPHKLIVPVHAHLKDYVTEILKDIENKEIISSDMPDFLHQKALVMQGADCAVATSGTVSFELAWFGTPTTVGYDASFLTRVIFKMLSKVRYASLANILRDREVIPEFLFENFKADNLVTALQNLANRADLQENQKAEFKKMREMMQPEIDAAGSVKRFLE